MGQRHQLFVIAKIAAKYRCLAAIHHQWLYGYRALRRLKDILDRFSNPVNWPALRRELRKAQSLPETFWDRPEYQQSIQSTFSIPFPFVMTSLTLGASFNAEEGYYHRVDPEAFNMKYNEGDNNNGNFLELRPFLSQTKSLRNKHHRRDGAKQCCLLFCRL